MMHYIPWLPIGGFVLMAAAFIYWVLYDKATQDHYHAVLKEAADLKKRALEAKTWVDALQAQVALTNFINMLSGHKKFRALQAEMLVFATGRYDRFMEDLEKSTK